MIVSVEQIIITKIYISVNPKRIKSFLCHSIWLPVVLRIAVKK